MNGGASEKRQLFVCCDGTWNIPENDSPTHISRIAKLAATDKSGPPRLVYYMRGVGGRYAMDRLLGGGIGQGLHANIKDAYLFLAANYRPKDRIFIFGFSRGAFTARCVVGMIEAVGLLKPEYTHQLGRAYRQYRNVLRIDEPEIDEDWVSHPAIDFLGVFDTVGALGIPVRGFDETYTFRNNLLPSSVLNARHALAIHEGRTNFTPTVWKAAQDEDDRASDADRVEQRWFVGVHSDIGGGYKHDRGQLGNVGFFSLQWMLSELSAKCGVEMSGREEVLEKLRAKEDPDKFEIHDSMKLGFWLFDKLRWVSRVFHEGDFGRFNRRIAESGAYRQSVDRSVWDLYLDNNPAKRKLVDNPPDNFLTLWTRHPISVLERKPRKHPISRNPELSKVFDRLHARPGNEGGKIDYANLSDSHDGTQFHPNRVIRAGFRALLRVGKYTLIIAALFAAVAALRWIGQELIDMDWADLLAPLGSTEGVFAIVGALICAVALYLATCVCLKSKP